jgi:hypothetical protein
MCVTDAGIVDAESGDGDVALSLVEPPCSDWIGWEEENEDDSPNDGYCSGDEIHVFPWRKGSGYVAQAVVDQRGEDGDIAGAAVPDSVTS